MLTVQILSPAGKIFNGQADAVNVPGTKGQFEILHNHAPIVSSLKEGSVLVRTGKGEESFKIRSGFVECLNNEVTVLVEGIVE